MISPKVTVKVPKIVIKTPENPFWKAVGIEVAKDIRKLTQLGNDADNRKFKPYKKSTSKRRIKRGRTGFIVNLTDTGKMLGAIPSGIRPKSNGVRLQLTGRQGFKAHNIKFNQRRNFFAFNEKRVERVIKKIKKWMKRKNK